MSDVSFEHGQGFEQGDLGGNVHLGKFEAHYEEIFAEVIEDGIITQEERARLDRAADSLGLDKARLRRLETALQAAYEARHQIKIQDLSANDGTSHDGRESLMPLEPATDPRTMSLQRRIAALEAKVTELESALREARANVAVEVQIDLAEMASARRSLSDDDPSPSQRSLRHDPRDASLYRTLYEIFGRRGEFDRKVSMAHVLTFLGAARAEERSLSETYRAVGLIRPTTSLSQDAWRRLLFHPEEEALTGEIFSVIVSAVLLGRVSALRRDKALVRMDPSKRQDPVQSTVQGIRCFSWAAAILGMKSPPLYADPDFDGTAEMVAAVPPAIRLGQRALSGRTPHELAFLAGRHLAFYREERFVRLLLPTIADLEDLFLAALHIGNPGIPLSSATKSRVMALSQAIEPILDSSQIDRLRGCFLRFVEDGGRTNLQRWASAADRTAGRAGLLLGDDLASAASMLKVEDPARVQERMDDLLVFMASDRYAQLRKQLGIALPIPS